MDYAVLNLCAGWVAGCGAYLLGDQSYIEETRKRAWRLTKEFVAEQMAEIRERCEATGIDYSSLDAPEFMKD